MAGAITWLRRFKATEFAAIRTGTDGTGEDVATALARPAVLLSEELFGFSAGKLAFDHGRMTYVIYFVNGKAVHKSAGKEKK